jgi:hypothetical protein
MVRAERPGPRVRLQGQVPAGMPGNDRAIWSACSCRLTGSRGYGNDRIGPRGCTNLRVIRLHMHRVVELSEGVPNDSARQGRLLSKYIPSIIPHLISGHVVGGFRSQLAFPIEVLNSPFLRSRTHAFLSSQWLVLVLLGRTNGTSSFRCGLWSGNLGRSWSSNIGSGPLSLLK